MKYAIQSKKPIVWTISGADCSGGAGIAADIKTAHGLQAEICHIITANTVQNSQKLVAVNPVSVDVLAQQAQLLLSDKVPKVIKIGLLATGEQIKWLSEFLAEIKLKFSVKIIFDPVGQASIGGKFSDLLAADLSPLWPLVDVITPNVMEAKAIAKTSTYAPSDFLKETQSDLEFLAYSIHELGVASVIIKGGHTDTEGFQESVSSEVCLDFCLHHFNKNESHINKNSALNIIYGVTSSRINTTYSHGGGCSFATALSVFIAHGHLLRDALTLAKAFMNQGLKAYENIDDSYGAFEQTLFPTNKAIFPHIETELTRKYHQLLPFKSLGLARLQGEKLGLYPVIDSLAWLKRLLALNLNIIQLRLKYKTPEELDLLIQEAVAIIKIHNSQAEQDGRGITRLFINDYWELAIKHGAYGVHIGQEDLLDANLSAIQKAGLALGISTHGCYEFLLAQQLQPSYLAIGAIFPTQTKDMTDQIQGVDNLAHILGLSSHIPVVAIGGITHELTPKVWDTGVDSIAVVTAITQAESPEKSVEQFQALMSSEH